MNIPLLIHSQYFDHHSVSCYKPLIIVRRTHFNIIIIINRLVLIITPRNKDDLRHIIILQLSDIIIEEKDNFGLFLTKNK